MKEPRKVLDSKTGTENRTGTEKLEPPSYNLDLEGQPPRASVPSAQGLAQEYDCRTNLDPTLKLNCLYPENVCRICNLNCFLTLLIYEEKTEFVF